VSELLEHQLSPVHSPQKRWDLNIAYAGSQARGG
jgi:hypothetical protein